MSSSATPTNPPPRAPKLQPLRIPQGWRVTYNDFREVDPGHDAAERLFLREDLLQARCEPTNVLVDLGWYPDGDPSGSFVVQVYLGDFRGEELLRATSDTRAGAVKLLEDAFLKYHFLPERGWS